MPDVEKIEAEESVESVLLRWYRDTARLRGAGHAVHQLVAELPARCSEHLAHRIPDAVERFLTIAGTARREDFEHLFFSTVGLHNRGVEVFHPERSPDPLASPFVRRMPEGQAEIEAKRLERQGRHMAAYESHIIASMEHFEQAWLAMLDGALAGDLDMIDDEFPKLAMLAAEVGKACEIWSNM
jgi:hypothetical protein